MEVKQTFSISLPTPLYQQLLQEVGRGNISKFVKKAVEKETSPRPKTVKSPFIVPLASGCELAKTLVIKRKFGESFSIAAATVKLFMFEAGIKYFSASLSNTTFSESSAAILTPILPRRRSGCRSVRRIFACRSKIVSAPVAEGFAAGLTLHAAPGGHCSVGETAGVAPVIIRWRLSFCAATAEPSAVIRKRTSLIRVIFFI